MTLASASQAGDGAAAQWRRDIPLPPGASLQGVPFRDLAGFAQDDHLEAFAVFLRSCVSIASGARALRDAVPAPASLVSVCRRALSAEVRDKASAQRFFETNFRAFRVSAKPDGSSDAFLTGYFEPVVDGSLAEGPDFSAPILSRPDDLVTLPSAASPGSGPLAGLAAARRLPDQSLWPYPDRAAIEAGDIFGHAVPIVWLRDAVEVFIVQVQGSARVRLADGTLLRLVYAGRNGQPYTSIGKILVDTGEIAAQDMSLARLKQWIRDHGQSPSEPGGALMQRNRSYIFFDLETSLGLDEGPVGGAGLSLSRLRSIAIDRSIWPYGLPAWIEAEIPWRDASPSPFRRLMIAQDTGSAIIGPARADIFFGSGDDAGARAGDIRSSGDFVIFLPFEEGSDR
ncbi:murein transglycosylase A [Methylocapsa palsarum]|uniref:murein transglycosylase A n=1 Tax=Methylocapsa palsarum TaxID=1612308 RepID=UPI001FCDF14B|nr:MltA domain-containing protein [Methylocapsa palsarum]